MVDDGCGWTRYIRPTAQDWQVISAELEAEILDHNEIRERRCS